MNKFHNWIIKKSLFTIWLLFFIFAVVVALLLQLFVLPILLPNLHAGHGLLAGGDWVGFHLIAVELSEKIQTQGWSAWELRPYGHSAAGLAGAVYAISWPEPYMFIPINAALHATAGILLIRITRFLTDDILASFYASLPFVLYPSAMAWYTQINKDGFYFMGAFLCLYGWIVLAHLPTWESGWKKVVMGLIWIALGIAIMGLVRTYSYQLMQAMGYIFAVGLSVLFIVRGARKKLSWQTSITAIVIVFLVPLTLRYAPIETRGSAVVIENQNSVGIEKLKLTLLKKQRQDAIEKQKLVVIEKQKLATIEKQRLDVIEKQKSMIIEKQKLAKMIKQSLLFPDVDSSVKPDRSWGGAIFAQDSWQKSEWLPAVAENNFLRIATLREGYLTTPGYKKAGSMIDKNVHFLSVNNVLAYFPRGAQIGFLAPFPSHWVAEGHSPGGSIMRRIAGIEMMGVYCALLFIPYILWINRKKVEMWLPFLFGTILIMLYGLTTPNIGSLYRLRYGFLMLFVSIGVAGLASVIRAYLKNRSTSLIRN